MRTPRAFHLTVLEGRPVPRLLVAGDLLGGAVEWHLEVDRADQADPAGAGPLHQSGATALQGTAVSALPDRPHLPPPPRHKSEHGSAAARDAGPRIRVRWLRCRSRGRRSYPTSR